MVVDELKKLAMGVGLIAGIIILLVIVSILVSEFRVIKPETESFTATNESLTFVLASKEIAAANRWDFVSIVNATDYVMTNGTNNTISSNNYFSPANGSVILKLGAANDLGATANVNVTYSATIRASSFYYNISTSGLQAFQNISKQSPLMGTLLVMLVIAAIALSIFAFFGGSKRNKKF